MLPVPWNPLLPQLWHGANSLLSGHTKEIFLKPTASGGTDRTVPGNAKLICGLRAPLHLVPFQNPSWVTLFFAPCAPAAGHRVCFTHHHPEANLRKRTAHPLRSPSFAGCCSWDHSFNHHRVHLQFELRFCTSQISVISLRVNGVKGTLQHLNEQLKTDCKQNPCLGHYFNAIWNFRRPQKCRTPTITRHTQHGHCHSQQYSSTHWMERGDGNG